MKGRLEYALQDVRLSQIVDPVATLEDVGTHTTSSTALNLSYEGRDDVLDPHRGVFLGLTLTYAGGPLRGGDDFVKGEGEIGGFLPLGSTVLALGARGGVAFPYACSERVPVHERFFAGGATRSGDSRRSAWAPRTRGGTPKGGEAVLTTSVELRVPVYTALGGVGLQEERGEDRWRVHFTLGHAF